MSDIAELVQRVTDWLEGPGDVEDADKLLADCRNALEAQAKRIVEWEDAWQKILKVLEPYAQGKGPPGGGGPR